MPAHALLPAVNRLLQQVEEVSGLPVAVAQQADLGTWLPCGRRQRDTSPT
jgi:hypothetical protein